MGKTTQYTIFILFILIAVSCSDSVKKGGESTATDTIVLDDQFVWPDSIPNIFMIPDSILANDSLMNDSTWTIQKLWTEDQKQLAMLIMVTFIENVRMENGRLEFAISREEFRGLSIPEAYYDMLLQNLEELNRIGNDKSDASGKTLEELWLEGRDIILKNLLEGKR